MTVQSRQPALARRTASSDPVPVGARLAYRFLVLAAFTATWTGMRIGPLLAVDWLLALSAVLAIPALAAAGVWVPRWVALPSFAVLIVLVGHIILPTSPSYMASRFELSGLSGLVVTVQESPVSVAFQWLAALLVLPILVRALILATGRSPEPILLALVAGGAASALVGLADYFGATAIGPDLIGYVANSGRQSGLGSHANNLGFASALLAPLAVYFMLRRRRATGLFLLLALAAGALVSGSRGSQVGFVVAILLSLVLTERGRKALPPLAYFGALAATLTVAFKPDALAPFSDLLRFGEERGVRESNFGRAQVAQQAIEDFQEAPFFGIGFEVLTQAHSIYLQLAAAGGLLLLLAFAYFFLGLLRAARDLNRSGIPVAGFIACSTGVWLTVGLIENQLTDRYLYLATAAVVALLSMERGRPDARDDGAAGRQAESALGTRTDAAVRPRRATSGRHR